MIGDEAERPRGLDGADAARHVVLVDLVLLQENVQRLLVLRERMAGHSKVGRMSTFYERSKALGRQCSVHCPFCTLACSALVSFPTVLYCFSQGSSFPYSAVLFQSPLCRTVHVYHPPRTEPFCSAICSALHILLPLRLAVTKPI